ncbi:hypothetical protein CJO92_14040 [Ralstonia solanacearum]|nr:hypothetical protein CJO92_14040 [Ralstonia solanacearum]
MRGTLAHAGPAYASSIGTAMAKPMRRTDSGAGAVWPTPAGGGMGGLTGAVMGRTVEMCRKPWSALGLRETGLMQY